MKTKVIKTAAALVALLMPVTTVADYIGEPQRVVLYPTAGELRMLARPGLSADAQNAFDNEFRPNTYYSAFALSKDGGWGWATTTNSLSGARAVAMAECETHNESCRVIAEIVPIGYVEMGEGDLTMTPVVMDLFLNPESVNATIDYIGMAVGADGAYSMVWGYATPEEAAAAALADCNLHIRTDLATLEQMPCVAVPSILLAD